MRPGLRALSTAASRTVTCRTSLQTRAMSSAAASARYPTPIVIPAAKEHRSTLIHLHGLGDSGHGWADIGYMLAEQLPHTQFVFPNAPTRPITLNGGMPMPGWYDIASLDRLGAQQDAEAMHESQRYIESLVQQQVDAGIASTSVVVGGFSQGGAVALLMLRSQLQLAGVLAMSTYLPLHEERPILSVANRQAPILMCHGDFDQVVDYSFGKASYEQLQAAGAAVELMTYESMGHEAREDELKDVTKFLVQRLGGGAQKL